MDLRVELEIEGTEVVATVHFKCRAGHKGQKRKTYPIHGKVEDHDREAVAQAAIAEVAPEIRTICNCGIADVYDAGARFLEETYGHGR